MTTPEQPEGPRGVLLQRIVDWFAVHGVLDTSMRTLAAGVGTSNRMLNYHSGSREELLAAVISRVCEAESAALEQCVVMTAHPLEAGSMY